MSPFDPLSGTDDTSMLLSIGVDAEGVVQGTEIADVALGELDNTAQKLSKTAVITSRDMDSVASVMIHVAQGTSTLPPRITLVSRLLQKLGLSVAGLTTGFGAWALALAPIAAFAMFLFWKKTKQADEGMEGLRRSLNDTSKAMQDGVAIITTYGETLDALHKRANALEKLGIDGITFAVGSLTAKIEEARVQVKLFSGETIDLGGGRFAGFDTDVDLAQFADKLVEARKTLASLQFERSALTARFTINTAREVRDIVGDTLANLRDLPPVDITFRAVGEFSTEDADAAAQVYAKAFMDGLERDVGAENAQRRLANRLLEGMGEEAQQVGQVLSSNIAGGLATAFRGGTHGFQNMLNQWRDLLINSAVFSLLMSLLNPGRTFGSFFKEIFSFQHGTPFVPQTGLAIVHRGEAVIPASQNTFTTRRSVMENADMRVIQHITIIEADGRKIAEQIAELSRRREAPFMLRN